jgi:hypothetical protein
MCFECDRRTEGLTCEAYPDGIPQAITLGRADHRLKLPGDKGLRFRGNDGALSVLGYPDEPEQYTGEWPGFTDPLLIEE